MTATFITLVVIVAKPIAAQTKPSLVITAITKHVADKRWNDGRIGFGLQQILSELMYDSGEFELKESSQELVDQRKAVVSALWSSDESRNDTEDSILTTESNVEYVLYGKVVYFGAPKSSFSFGPVKSNKKTYKIKVELVLKHQTTGEELVAEGEGSSTTTISSALFQFYENKLEWDKTNIGNATKDALAQAVSTLLREFSKK